MIIFKIYLFLFLFINLLCYLWAKDERNKKTMNPLFDKIRANYPIVKINNNIFYFKGLYITPDFVLVNHSKIKHYQNLNFILNILKIAKIKK